MKSTLMSPKYSSYLRLYIFLKAQRTIIESVHDRLSKIEEIIIQNKGKTQNKEIISNGNAINNVTNQTNKLHELIFVLDTILKSDFKTNIVLAQNFIAKTKDINNATFSTEVTKLVNVFTSSCVAFIKFRGLLVSNFQFTACQQQKQINRQTANSRNAESSNSNQNINNNRKTNNYSVNMNESILNLNDKSIQNFNESSLQKSGISLNFSDNINFIASHKFDENHKNSNKNTDIVNNNNDNIQNTIENNEKNDINNKNKNNNNNNNYNNNINNGNIGKDRSRSSVNENEDYSGCFKDSDNNDIMICRLCNENIHISLFEEHIKSCAIAFKSESKIKSVNEQLDSARDSICGTFLSGQWPGERDHTIRYVFPMLHLAILLQHAKEIEANTVDSTEELEDIGGAILQIPVIEEVHGKYVLLAAKLVREKIDLSIVLCDAAKVLRKTRLSGSDRATTLDTVNITDFDFVKLISSGAYARVFLAKMKSTGDIYAIKVTPKSSLTHKNEVLRILTEKDIMLQFNHPYIVTFYYSFTGRKNLYLVMEYLPGGDLYSLLQNVGSFDESTAKLYTYEVLTALQYLHSHGIIHRDLKPDNILVSKDGAIKLADFGLSHLGLIDRQNSEELNESSAENTKVVGTPDYIAPEILMQRPHSFPADYWSLGCMLYEFLLGIPPFHAETEEDTFKNILRGVIDFSDVEADEFSEEAIDLIKKLLVHDPAKRLGSKGIDEILSHNWFKGIDIENMEPPFKPELKSNEDTEYFMQRYNFPDDSDILEDINDIEENKENDFFNENENINNNRGSANNSFNAKFSTEIRKRSGVTRGGTNKRTLSLNIDPKKEQFNTLQQQIQSQELKDFPAVAVDQLLKKNKEVLSKAQQQQQMQKKKMQSQEKEKQNQKDDDDQQIHRRSQSFAPTTLSDLDFENLSQNLKDNNTINNNHCSGSNNNSSGAAMMMRLPPLGTTAAATNARNASAKELTANVPTAPTARKKTARNPTLMMATLENPYFLKKISAKPDDNRSRLRHSRARHRKEVQRLSMMADVKLSVKPNMFE